MRDMMLDALLPESMSDEAAYNLVYFLGDLTRTLGMHLPNPDSTPPSED